MPVKKDWPGIFSITGYGLSMCSDIYPRLRLYTIFLVKDQKNSLACYWFFIFPFEVNVLQKLAEGKSTQHWAEFDDILHQLSSNLNEKTLILAELQNSALNLMCDGRVGVNNWFPDCKSDTFWDVVMKLHTLTPHESRMHPIDFEVKRLKVKVMEHV